MGNSKLILAPGEEMPEGCTHNSDNCDYYGCSAEDEKTAWLRLQPQRRIGYNAGYGEALGDMAWLLFLRVLPKKCVAAMALAHWLRPGGGAG